MHWRRLIQIKLRVFAEKVQVQKSVEKGLQLQFDSICAIVKTAAAPLVVGGEISASWVVSLNNKKKWLSCDLLCLSRYNTVIQAQCVQVWFAVASIPKNTHSSSLHCWREAHKCQTTSNEINMCLYKEAPSNSISLLWAQWHSESCSCFYHLWVTWWQTQSISGGKKKFLELLLFRPNCWCCIIQVCPHTITF